MFSNWLVMQVATRRRANQSAVTTRGHLSPDTLLVGSQASAAVQNINRETESRVWADSFGLQVLRNPPAKSQRVDIPLERLREERTGDGLPRSPQRVLHQALDIDLGVDVPQGVAHVRRGRVGQHDEAKAGGGLQIVKLVGTRAARIEASISAQVWVPWMMRLTLAQERRAVQAPTFWVTSCRPAV